jgi:integrase
LNNVPLKSLDSPQGQSSSTATATATATASRIYPVIEGVGSKYTQVIYAGNFNRFLNHIKIHDLQVLLDFSPKVIKQMIIDYILYLREREIKRGSIKTQVAAILHFFQINNDDFNLKMNNFRLHLPLDESINEDRPYTTQEIAQVITQGCPDLRAKVAVLLFCSSGIRMGALHSLQIGDLTKIERFNLHLYNIQVYARTRDKYHTFTTPEAAQAIHEWFAYRRSGEELKDKSPLIREQFNTENPFTVNSPRFVSESGIEYILTHALKQAGVRKPKEIHATHGFRKFFKTQCEYSGMRSINIELLMGHNIGVSGRYYRPTESEVLQDYLKAVDLLTIDPTHRLQKENQELRSENTGEIAKLKAQLFEHGEANKQTQIEMKVQKAQVDELLRFCKSIGWPFIANSAKISAGYRARKKEEAEAALSPPS